MDFIKAEKHKPASVPSDSGLPASSSQGGRRGEDDKTEREKNLAIWAGVTFFMILIVFVWLMNFKSGFDIVPKETSKKQTTELKDILNDTSQAGTSFKELLEEAKSSFSELSNILKEGVSNDVAVDGRVNGISEEMKNRIELEKMMFELNKKIKEKK